MGKHSKYKKERKASHQKLMRNQQPVESIQDQMLRRLAMGESPVKLLEELGRIT